MKTRDVLRFIERAGKKYNEYLSACDPIAQQAQKYIDWSDVTCEFINHATTLFFYCLKK